MKSSTSLNEAGGAMGLKVFVDFDGTVAARDVGNAFFRRFGGPGCDGIIEAYHEGRITAVECFRGECALIRAITHEALEEFLDEQTLDPGFPAFVRFCGERGLDLTIVSDGLDYYIDAILARHGVQGVARVANHMELEPAPEGDGVLPVLSFPHGDGECQCCACCKRNVMLSRSGDDDVIVYVGDGFSDQCPVQYADVVFAKRSLQAFCQRENISYYLYETFDDVLTRLREMLGRPRVRKRRRAELKRREAFTRE